MVCGVGVGWPDWTRGRERIGLDWIGRGRDAIAYNGDCFCLLWVFSLLATSSYVCFEHLLEHIDA